METYKRFSILLIGILLTAFMMPTALAVDPAVNRDLPDSVARGSTFDVILSIDVDEGDLPYVLGVKENIPDGCTFSSASSDGFNFESDNTIEWIFLESSLLTQIISEGITFINLLEDQSITYTLGVPSGFSGDTVTFSGITFFGGTTDPAIGGEVEMSVIGVLGDINGDDNMNVFDLALLGQAWGSSTGDADYNADADLNGDGVINVFDLAILGQNWG